MRVPARPRVIRVVVSALAVGVLSLGAIVPAATAAPAVHVPAVGTGWVTGTVTDEQSGTGLDDAWMQLLDANWRYVTSTYTDPAGEYRIDDLAPGTYFLQAQPSYLDDNVAEWYPNAPSVPLAEPFQVVAYQETAGIDLVLAHPVTWPAYVNGHVHRDGTNTGIYVSVEAWSVDGSTLVATAWTDRDPNSGYFEFGLPAGDYKLRLGGVNPGGYSDYAPEWYPDAPDAASATTVHLAPGLYSGIPTAYLSRVIEPFASAPVPELWQTPTVGTTLTAQLGTWNPVPDEFQYRWERDGVPIPGADGASYQLVEADATHAIRVVVTGSKAGYRTATRWSAQTAMVTGATLTATPIPTISGTPLVGQTLSSSTGEWGPAPVTLAYRWYANGSAISGATGSSFQLTYSQATKLVTVRVTGTRLGYTTVTKESTATAPITGVFYEPRKPLIEGDHGVGSTVTANPRSWGPTPDSFSYQWAREDVAIGDAASPNYVLTQADAGHLITVTVRATKSGYLDLEQTSDPIFATGGILDPPTPVIDGMAAANEELRVEPGDWGPATTLSYQWLLDGSPIQLATNDTLLVPDGWGGGRISVQVTGYRSGFDVAMVESAQTARIFVSAPWPSRTGSSKVGSTFTAHPGTWSPAATLSYQWYRDGVPIAGATKQSYKLTVWDSGAVVDVAVTGSAAGYQTTLRRSSGSARIAGGSFTSAPTPKISGTAKVGSVLTAKPGTWVPTPALSYQWKRNGTSITGATGPSYTPTNTDVGKQLTVTVTARHQGITAKSKTSSATAKVSGGVFTPGAATISGTQKVGSKLTAKATGFSPTPTSYSYRWYRNGVSISAATKSTHTLSASDQGKVVTVKITATRSYFTSRSVTSAPTVAIVGKAFTKAPTPTISGAAVVGAKLTAASGTWSPTATLSYQWFCDGVAIPGATARTLVLSAAESGFAITASVTARRSGYQTTVKTSAATALVG